MLICPVCRSQNMETAKFCGNCGNSFSRSADSTSSLINCAQGHIYSAVYQHCPYCPQPSTGSSSELDAANFVTRVEDLSTSIDFSANVSGDLTAAPAGAAQNLGNEFVTRVGPIETLFEPPETPAVLEPEPVHAPTEVISAFPTHEINNGVEPEPQPAQPELISSVTAAAPEAAPVPSPVPPFPPPKADQDELDRRTIAVAEQTATAQGARGKIVGWLITYSRHADGDDFRIYDGYNRIGANQVCDIVVEDETVSGSHAIIVYREGRCLVKDDLSRNGTFVNGREITEAYPLQNYDQIRVGNTHLIYVSAQRSS